MPGIEVKVHEWRSVASWSWTVPSEDVCGICRSKFEATCPDCRIPGDDCPLITGECNHVFHLHCLLKWLAKQELGQQAQSCPMDRRPWKTKT